MAEVAIFRRGRSPEDLVPAAFFLLERMYRSMVLKRKIEDRSITALQRVIDAHPTMEGHIQKGDKELSWDGYIRLYQDDESESDKANFDDDVPIQIKGHIVKERKVMAREYLTSSVDLEDLKVYYKRFGCLYFVMFMNEDGSVVEIFYSSLYPSKIKKYLGAAEKKGNKGTISIPFIKMKKDDKELYRLCKQFSFEVRKQGSGCGQIVPRSITGDDLKKVKIITATAVGGDTPYDLLKKINTGDAVLYGVIDDSKIEYPIQLDQIVASVNQIFHEPIYVGKKQYYSSFKMKVSVSDPDTKQYSRTATYTLNVSKNLTFTFTDTKINVNFRFLSDIFLLKKDAEFFLDMLEKREVVLFGGKILIGQMEIHDDFKAQLQGIIRIGQILEDIGCNIMIPFTEYTDEDIRQLVILNGIQSGQIVFQTDKKAFLYNWEFRGKKWPIFVELIENKVKLNNFVFNLHYTYTINGSEEEKNNVPEIMPDDALVVPNFLWMEPELLANLYYYDYESMYEQINRTVYNENTINALNILALNLILAYDINGNEKLLDVAAEVLERLIKCKSDAPHFIVNLSQIEIRKTGKLSKLCRQKLKEIERIVTEKLQNKNETTMEKMLLYCIAVINKNMEEADKKYLSLKAAEKEAVDAWPIRNLHKQLKRSVK